MITGEIRRRAESRNMYKGPMDKDKRVRGGLNVVGGGWVRQRRIKGEKRDNYN